MERKVIQVEERPPLLLNIPLSIQHLFAMFGATVLVPFLFNVNPTTCLFMNGIGTLLYFSLRVKYLLILVPVSLLFPL